MSRKQQGQSKAASRPPAPPNAAAQTETKLARWKFPHQAVQNWLLLLNLFAFGYYVHLIQVQNASTERQMKVGARPWIVDDLTQKTDVTIGPRLTASRLYVYLKNSGNSPAVDVVPFACIVLGNPIKNGDTCEDRVPAVAVIGDGKQGGERRGRHVAAISC